MLENTTNNPFPAPGNRKGYQAATIAEGLVFLYVSNVGFGPVSIAGGGQVVKITIDD